MEAELLTISEVVKELECIIQVLGTMKIEVKLSMTVHVDNVGVIFMATNHKSSDPTQVQ